MSTGQDRERSLENEVPEGVSPTGTRTGTEGDSAASYGSAPISEAEASGAGATSAAGSAGSESAADERIAAGESTAAADERTAGGAAERTAAATSTGEAERTATDKSTGEAERTAAGGNAAAGKQEIGDQPLFGAADVERLRTAWRQLQGSFVDSPHDAVTQADDLVMATVQQLSATLAERKQSLERLWSREEDGDTEDLRLALRSYRAFFDQLVGTGK
ncbi:hypothetical protein OIE68_25520 [Nocardia vinacea]|uniref:Uncharacterized protein n=1 Tax=Nocardia vinacea TaxID=96468 RepID=A0ABZ1Z030_9NOCA|nr:hypothetical protein OIE68_25520 [Nocardia vinacea]